MSWENPKTNWGQSGQTVPGAGDFNRIEGNIQHLQDTKETPAGAQAKAEAAAGAVQAELNTHKAEDATTSQKGHVEIATNAEASAGISTELAVTPAGLMYALELLGLKVAKVSTETNLDNYQNSGTFITPASGVTNLPAGWTQARHVVLVAGSSSYCLQILASSSSGKIAYRVGASSALGDWKELLDPSGFTMSGALDMADNQLIRPEIKDYAETVGTTPATTGSVTFNLTTGNVFNLTPTGNVTIGFTNWPASGKGGSVTVRLKNGATVYSKTFAAAIKWVNDEIPDLSEANKTYDLVFSTTDAGTVIHGACVGPYSA